MTGFILINMVKNYHTQFYNKIKSKKVQMQHKRNCIGKLDHRNPRSEKFITRIQITCPRAHFCKQ